MRSAPLVVVGTPGSGTRVFARLAIAAGYDLGPQTEANDAAELRGFAGRWCGRVYSDWAAGRAADYAEFASELRASLDSHLRAVDLASPWGWKQPRSLYMLPALHAVFPDLLVVHVIRDGRDVAFSPNAGANVLLSGGYALPSTAENRPTAVKAAMLWDVPNRLAADFGQQRFGDRYLRLSFEQVCAEPDEAAARLSSFVGGEPIESGRLRSIVDPPASLGRWRQAEPALLAEVEAAAVGGLRRFGYALEG